MSMHQRLAPALLAAALFLAAPAPAAVAQETQPFVGQYELRAGDGQGEMTIGFEDSFYTVSIFTTNDGAMHFCDFMGQFAQEEQSLFELTPLSGNAPMIIFIRDGFMEIEQDQSDSCGLNQTMAGKYYPVQSQ